MLAFLFRGVFLIGVLSWYSTSVWKMIDEYFKNQFQRYLRDEFEKNPQMRADVAAYRSTDKEDPIAPTAGSVENLNEVVEVCCEESCTVGKKEDKDYCEVTKSPTDEIIPVALKDQPGKIERESRRSKEEEEQLSDPLPRSKKKISGIKKSRTPAQKPGTRRGRTKGRMTSGKEAKRRGKTRFETIKLTNKDFASTRIKPPLPEDFAEFDSQDEPSDSWEDESDPGILVSELIVKPKIDLSHLRRISSEEFCPVTKEDDESSCDDITKWP